MKLSEPDRERRENKPVGPAIEIRSAEIARFQLRLAESAEASKPDRRKKAVRVFGFAGREPPMTIRDWQLLAETAKRRVEVAMCVGPDVDVWFVAQWVDAKGRCGPTGEVTRGQAQYPLKRAA